MSEPVSERVLALVLRMVAARAEVNRIKSHVASFLCEVENNEANSFESDGRVLPCWKKAIVDAKDAADYEDHYGLLHDEAGEWCEQCQLREQARKPLPAAVAKLGNLRGAITRMGMRLSSPTPAAQDG